MKCRSDLETEADEEAAEGGGLSDDEGGKQEQPLSRSQITKRAVAMLLAGTAACAFFSDPMVSAVTNFSRVCFCLSS